MTVEYCSPSAADTVEYLVPPSDDDAEEGFVDFALEEEEVRLAEEEDSPFDSGEVEEASLDLLLLLLDLLPPLLLLSFKPFEDPDSGEEYE